MSEVMLGWPASVASGTVYVNKHLDEDGGAICAVLAWADLNTRLLESLDKLDSAHKLPQPACLVMDLPDFTPEIPGFLNHLNPEEADAIVERGTGKSDLDSHTLVICASCYASPTRPLKGQTLAFLRRPYTRRELLEAVFQSLSCPHDHGSTVEPPSGLLVEIGRLTPRERQVMDGVYEGLSNKSVALQLNISTRSVEAARASLLKKLNAESAIALVRRLASEGYRPEPFDENL